MSFETSAETDRGFLLSGREWRVVGGASALMALNVLLIYVLVVTPLAAVNDYLFSVPILGVIVYGAAIVAGEWIAERGLEGGNLGLAAVGLAILQLAFGTFGAGVLSFAPRGSHLAILAVSAVVVALLTAAIATYVYARARSFEHWGRYGNYAFLGGIVAVGVGSLFAPVLLLGFVLIFLGFLLRLGWEIWRVRDRRVDSVALQAVGVYVAVAGVFVHVLQLVVRTFASRS